jgi:thermitase
MTKQKPQSKRSILISLAILVATVSFPFVSPPGNSPSAGPTLSPATQAQASTNPLSSALRAIAPPAALAATPAIPASAGQLPHLPSYPHPQYKYVALTGSTPTGPLYSMEPFLNRISAPGGWAAATSTNAAPTIAVIDTGFALNHQALAGRWDGLGWDFIHNDSSPMAGTDNPNGAGVFHGTMTAGLAGLLNANAQIMPLQAMSDDGVGYTDEIAAAVTYAADNGAKVISLSLGSSSDDPYLHQQIDYAISRGVLVVAAAGNSGCDCLSYPAAYPEVLSVGATDSADNRAGFSSYGSNLDVMGPGTAGDVCSAFYTAGNPTSAYSCSYSGTSFSTPLTASLAAMLIQQEPGITPSQLIATIDQTADKVAGMGGQYDSLTYGYGRIDVARAMAQVSIRAPAGQVLNKQSISLSSVNATTGPQMATTCTGVPGATCDLVLVGPVGQTIDLGQQVLDAQFGGTLYTWNAATLGLTPGTWTITATQTDFGQSLSLAPVALTISP